MTITLQTLYANFVQYCQHSMSRLATTMPTALYDTYLPVTLSQLLYTISILYLHPNYRGKRTTIKLHKQTCHNYARRSLYQYATYFTVNTLLLFNFFRFTVILYGKILNSATKHYRRHSPLILYGIPHQPTKSLSHTLFTSISQTGAILLIKY
jgi:hypothetical protein